MLKRELEDKVRRGRRGLRNVRTKETERERDGTKL